MPGDALFEAVLKAFAPRRIEFIETEVAHARQQRDEKAIAGARFEHDIIGLGLRHEDGEGREVDRRRELLPVELLLAAHGLGRHAGGESDGRLDVAGGDGGARFGAKGKGEGVLERLKAVALGPFALCVGAAVG